MQLTNEQTKMTYERKKYLETELTTSLDRSVAIATMLGIEPSELLHALEVEIKCCATECGDECKGGFFHPEASP
jgi:hypothetical protein